MSHDMQLLMLNDSSAKTFKDTCLEAMNIEIRIIDKMHNIQNININNTNTHEESMSDKIQYVGTKLLIINVNVNAENNHGDAIYGNDASCYVQVFSNRKLLY